MTLTVGTAPFGSAPAGHFDVDPHAPEHVMRVEPSPGVAQYSTLRDGDREERDVVWSCASPVHEAGAVEVLCPFTERLERTVDPPVSG